MKSGAKNRIAVGVMMAAATLGGGLAHAVGVSGQGTWETTLQPRDIDGDTVTDAFYDTVLGITWLRNADVNGFMNWGVANAWASTLVVGGIGGWRLPMMVDTGAPGCDESNAGGTDCGYNVQTRSGGVTYSEIAHLHYVTLGNKAICPPGDATCAGGPQPGWGLTNTGGFQNLQANDYWFGTEYALNPNDGWFININDGNQTWVGKQVTLLALAVRSGDVAAPIPEPQTYAMLLLGLGVLSLTMRRRPG